MKSKFVLHCESSKQTHCAIELKKWREFVKVKWMKKVIEHATDGVDGHKKSRGKHLTHNKDKRALRTHSLEKGNQKQIKRFDH